MDETTVLAVAVAVPAPDGETPLRVVLWWRVRVVSLQFCNQIFEAARVAWRMDRRAFLATSGTVLVAGCSSGGSEATDTTQDSTDAAGGTTAQTTAQATTGSSDATTASEPTATGNGDQTTTSASVEAGPEMAIASSGWHDGSDELEFTVKNLDETSVGAVQVGIKWFDNGDRYLGQTNRTLAALGPEKTWYTRVEPSVPYEASDYEITTRSRLLPSWTPDKFDLDVQATGVEGVKGMLSNTTNEVAGATIIGIGYDQDSVGYTGLASASEIPANTEWRFNAPFSRVSPQYIKLTDVRVIVTDHGQSA